MRQVRIHSTRVKDFERRLRAIEKKARKAGIEPPKAQFSTLEEVPYFSYDGKDLDSYDGSRTPRGYHVYHIYMVTKPDYQLPGGWELKAAIEHEEEANMIYSWDGDKSYEEFRKAPAICDHCKTNRKRNLTYLVKNSEGDLRQVGKTCLKEYMGIDAAKALLAIDSTRLENMGWDGEAKIPSRYPIHLTIALAKEEIETSGYHKTSEKNSTKDAVIETFMMLESRNEKVLQSAKGYIAKALDKHGQYAKEAVIWMKSETFDNDYLNNLKAICLTSSVSTKRMGLLVSMPLAYDNHLKKLNADKTNDIESVYFGRVGDKIGTLLTKSDRTCERLTYFTNLKTGEIVAFSDTRLTNLRAQDYDKSMLAGLFLTVTTRKVVDGYYGVSTLLKMVDSEGHLFVYFKSGYFDEVVDPGDQIILKGTIKRHEIFNNVKQTVLTRCSITKLQGVEE